MIITKYLEEPCPICGCTGDYGNICVTDNFLNRGCNNCRQNFGIDLPDIRKKIIYLDQFFLSHAFREQTQPFVDAAKRIKDMAARQLIVCPYSSVHTDETHLWRSEQKENLYNFIKQTARGHEFNQPYEIKNTQLHRAFEAFRSEDHPIQPIDESDAFHANIHQWDSYLYVDLGPILGDLEVMRQAKMDAIDELIKLFPDWANLKTSFREDLMMEARGYGRSLMQQYMQTVIKVSNGDLLSYLESSIETMLVESLLRYDSQRMEIDKQLQRISDFFLSDYFMNIPNIKVSCGLFSILRKKVKNGAYKNPDTARKKLSGLFYDSECISVFGPYCDGIFIDRAMKQWCEDPEAMLLKPFDTRIFSVASWNEFHSYLDTVEENYTKDIQEALSCVYPDIYK